MSFGEGPALQRDGNESEPHLLDQRDAPNQVESDFIGEVALEDSITTPSSSGLRGNDDEAVRTPGGPGRERREPKLFTYSQLAKSVCYSIGPPANHTFWYQPLSYRHNVDTQ